MAGADARLRVRQRPLTAGPMAARARSCRPGSYRGEDVYAAVRLSTLDTLSTGTTTSVEFSHAPTLEFADGTLDALEDSGMRFVLAYRFRVGREAHVRTWSPSASSPNPVAYLPDRRPGPRARGAALADLRASLAMARELGVMLNLHFLETIGDRASNPVGVLQTVGAFDNFEGRLLLGHAIHLTDAELISRRSRCPHRPQPAEQYAPGLRRYPAAGDAHPRDEGRPGLRRRHQRHQRYVQHHAHGGRPAARQVA